MEKVKEIINCETNKKFILVSRETGSIRIPDIILYLHMKDGSVKTCEKDLHEDLPQVGKEYEEGGELLLGWIDKTYIERCAEFMSEDWDDSNMGKVEARQLLEKLKEITPYLNIKEDVEDFR